MAPHKYKDTQKIYLSLALNPVTEQRPGFSVEAGFMVAIRTVLLDFIKPELEIAPKFLEFKRYLTLTSSECPQVLKL